MRFAEEFIDKVREANDLVEIIGQYTELKGSGHRLMGRCPFPDHSDKSPSFSVSEDNQLYFCYGCKKGGNVYTFLETFNGMSFPEAVEFLARRASIPLPEASVAKDSGAAREQKDLLLKVNKLAAVFYHRYLKSLPEDHVAKTYMQKRGLSAETVEKFRLGVSPEEWQGLTSFLKEKGAPMSAVETLGLVKQKRNSRPEDSHFDLFRDRLMFPIFSATGDVIGFGGRTLQADGLPKYLNSSDSPVFNKSRVLYGIHETGKFIRAEDCAVVVEGYMDAIALYTAGIKNVVAILGTAFTPEHAKVLKRYSPNVIMLLDGDEAGLNGAERSLPILLEAGLMSKGFALPNKMDPDDFVKAHGVERLREEIARAPELFSLLLSRRWMIDYRGSASEKVRIVEQAAVVLSRAQNRQLIELYLLELARQLDVDISWVRKALTTAISSPRPATAQVNEAESTKTEMPAPAPEALEKISLKKAPKDEGFVLSLLVRNEGLLKEFIEAGPSEVMEMFSHAGVRAALAAVEKAYRQRPEGFHELASAMVSRVDEPAVLSAAVAPPDLGVDAVAELERKLMADYMNAIRQRFLKNQGKALASRLKASASPEELEEFMNIQRHRMGLEKD